MTIEEPDFEGRDEPGPDDTLLAEWAAELAVRVRAGKPIDPEELAREHPERAEALRHLLPAIALMAELASSARRGDSIAPGPFPDDTLPPGLADLPDCEIKREIGRGGMGVVYLAHNTLMGRDEVLKVMGRRVVERPGVLDRFLREIRAVARLRHPNIVAAYHASRLGESLVLAMEYVEGLDLSRLVKARGPMPVAFACFCARQVALGLQHAHEHGMVHRDIKPGNLMLAREGDNATVKILDFGLAKVAREGKVDGALTDEGQAVGTPDYMAPEQITDAASADIRADIYSLGCTLYYFLAGHPPFHASSLYDIYQAHISREPDPLCSVRPEVPAELAALVATMMAKDPARRFQTPDEVARALEPFVKKGTVAFRSPKAEVSEADLTTESRAVTEAFSAPTPGTTEPEVSVVLPELAAESAAPEALWEDLIEWRETEDATQAAPALAPTRRPPWVWPSVAALLLTFGLLAALLGGVFKVKTPEGTIVLANVPRDSEVLVDGSKITFTWPGGGKPLEIRAVPGQRRIEVRTGGFKTFGEVVTVKTDELEEVTVRLEPLVVARPAKEPMPAADVQGWTTLFNGKDLSGWTVDSGSRDDWRVEEGNIVARGPGGWEGSGFLLSDRDFADFHLRFEFQPSPSSNSGVTFRALPGEFAGRALPHPLQVELVDRGGNYRYGSFIWSSSTADSKLLPPDSPTQLKPAGSWNTMDLEVQADSLRVSVNGKKVLIRDLGKLADEPGANPALRRRSGRIGFQSHTGTVRFRNIEIKELAPRDADTRGVKQVDEVRREGVPPARAKVEAITEPRAFAVLGGQGVAERTFDTLIEAVQASSDGDTIEVRGNGPFVTKPVGVRHSLTIRAAAGFRPVIRLSPDAADTRADLIGSASRLVLEGLELWGTRLHAAKPDAWTVMVLMDNGAPLHVANCRLVDNGSHRCIEASPRLSRLTNCELLGEDGDDVSFAPVDQGRLTIDNCLLVNQTVLIQYVAPGIGGVNLQVTRSTWAPRYHAFQLHLKTPPILPDMDRRSAAVALDVSRTVICVPHPLLELNQSVSQSGAQALPVEEADGFLRRFLQWRGEHNAYFSPRGLLSHSVDMKRVGASTIKQLDEWRQYWGSAEPGCIQGTVKFQGGDLIARAASAPEQLTPEDFRLRPDSAGYRAGSDGKDLGADIDLVGPGPAYERWKKTPAYQEWLKDTGQLAAEVLDDATRARKRLEARVAAARRMVELRPDDVQAHLKLGDALFAQRGRDAVGRDAVEESQDEYREAIRLKPDDPRPHFLLARALDECGSEAEAIPEYCEGIRLEPEDSRGARKNLVDIMAGSSNLRVRNPVEALKHARKLIEITHGVEAGYWRVLALAEYRSGHANEALAALETSKRLGGPQDVFEWFIKALSHAQRGEKDQARPWYDKAVAEMKATRGGENRTVRTLWAEADKLLGQPGPDSSLLDDRPKGPPVAEPAPK